MTPKQRAERYTSARSLLQQAQGLLGDELEAGPCGHLARACQIRATILDATVVVELAQKIERFTSRQDPTTGALTLTDKETGEKRVVSLQDFAALGSLERAWRKVGP